jgi:beta-glucosidase
LVWDSEPGDFDIMIGATSADIRLKDSFELIK